MPVKVSICIPAYNQIQYLSKNLNSIAEQSFTNYEVIISDDSTNDVVQNFVRDFFSDKNISYTYHKNPQSLGSPANWNKAISMAKGEYIKIMHHDDWFSNTNSLKVFVEALEQHPNAHLAFCSTSILNVADNTYTQNKPNKYFLQSLKNDASILFNENRIGAPTAIIYRAKDQLYFDEKLSYLVDVEFYIRLLKKHPEFVFIEAPLIVNTSQNPNQVTAQSMNKTIQIGEYCYLYNLVFEGKIPTKAYRDFFRSLFRRYELKSLQEITEMGYPQPKPTWFFRYLLCLSKIKSNG